MGDGEGDAGAADAVEGDQPAAVGGTGVGGELGGQRGRDGERGVGDAGLDELGFRADGEVPLFVLVGDAVKLNLHVGPVNVVHRRRRRADRRALPGQRAIEQRAALRVAAVDAEADGDAAGGVERQLVAAGRIERIADAGERSHLGAENAADDVEIAGSGGRQGDGAGAADLDDQAPDVRCVTGAGKREGHGGEADVGSGRLRAHAARDRAGVDDLLLQAVRIAGGRAAGEHEAAAGVADLQAGGGEQFDRVAAADRADLAGQIGGDVGQGRAVAGGRALQVAIADSQGPDVALLDLAVEGQGDTGVIGVAAVLERGGGVVGDEGIAGVAGAADLLLVGRRRIDAEVVDVVAAVAAADNACIRRGRIDLLDAGCECQVADGRIVEGIETGAHRRGGVAAVQTLPAARVVRRFLLGHRLRGEQEGVLHVLLDRHLQLVVGALGHAILVVGGDLDVIGAGLGDLVAEHAVIGETEDDGGAAVVGRLQVAGGQQLGQPGLRRIERILQLPQAQQAGPHRAVAGAITVVDIEGYVDAGIETGALGSGQGAPGFGVQHLLGHLERIEVGVAVAAAQHGQVRDGGRIGDVGIGVGVPFRGIDVLRQEHRIVDPELTRDRGAEVADEERVALAVPQVDVERRAADAGAVFQLDEVALRRGRIAAAGIDDGGKLGDDIADAGIGEVARDAGDHGPGGVRILIDDRRPTDDRVGLGQGQGPGLAEREGAGQLEAHRGFLAQEAGAQHHRLGGLDDMGGIPALQDQHTSDIVVDHGDVERIRHLHFAVGAGDIGVGGAGRGIADGGADRAGGAGGRR